MTERVHNPVPQTLAEEAKEAGILVENTRGAEAKEGNMLDLLVFKEFETWDVDDGKPGWHIKELYKEQMRYLNVAIRILTETQEKMGMNDSTWAAVVLPLRRQFSGLDGAQELAHHLKQQADIAERRTIFSILTAKLRGEDIERLVPVRGTT